MVWLRERKEREREERKEREERERERIHIVAQRYCLCIPHMGVASPKSQANQISLDLANSDCPARREKNKNSTDSQQDSPSHQNPEIREILAHSAGIGRKVPSIFLAGIALERDAGDEGHAPQVLQLLQGVDFVVGEVQEGQALQLCRQGAVQVQTLESVVAQIQSQQLKKEKRKIILKKAKFIIND